MITALFILVVKSIVSFETGISENQNWLPEYQALRVLFSFALRSLLAVEAYVNCWCFMAMIDYWLGAMISIYSTNVKLSHEASVQLHTGIQHENIEKHLYRCVLTRRLAFTAWYRMLKIWIFSNQPPMNARQDMVSHGSWTHKQIP